MREEQGPPNPTQWWQVFILAFVGLLVLLLVVFMALR